MTSFVLKMIECDPIKRPTIFNLINHPFVEEKIVVEKQSNRFVPGMCIKESLRNSIYDMLHKDDRKVNLII